MPLSLHQKLKQETAIRDDFASRKAGAYKASSSPRQKFVHFGPVTEIDQQTWKQLPALASVGRDQKEASVTARPHMLCVCCLSGHVNLKEDHMLNPQNDCRYFHHYMCRRRSAWESLPLLKSSLTY